jgi:hypothetical protein
MMSELDAFCYHLGSSDFSPEYQRRWKTRFPYEVEVSTSTASTPTNARLIAWLQSNGGYLYEFNNEWNGEIKELFTTTFYFNNADTAMLFKLRWK